MIKIQLLNDDVICDKCLERNLGESNYCWNCNNDLDSEPNIFG